MKQRNDPWSQLNASGEGLSVDDFLTTKVVRLGEALRKQLTQRYVETAGLTQSQWRILSVVAEHPRMKMNDLVIEAAVDKALVSRVLRQLEVLGLVELESVPNAPRKGLRCKLSAKGTRLYAKTIGLARRIQAEMLLRLSESERSVAYRVITKLTDHCRSDPGSDKA